MYRIRWIVDYCTESKCVFIWKYKPPFMTWHQEWNEKYSKDNLTLYWLILISCLSGCVQLQASFFSSLPDRKILSVCFPFLLYVSEFTDIRMLIMQHANCPHVKHVERDGLRYQTVTNKWSLVIRNVCTLGRHLKVGLWSYEDTHQIDGVPSASNEEMLLSELILSSAILSLITHICFE